MNPAIPACIGKHLTLDNSCHKVSSLKLDTKTHHPVFCLWRTWCVLFSFRQYAFACHVSCMAFSDGTAGLCHCWRGLHPLTLSVLHYQNLLRSERDTCHAFTTNSLNGISLEGQHDR